ncbi:MAG: PilN domain-containing protein [Puniceicoccales bacterium]|jgi:Tfp pilus assembly protein PilN|nr:PilN domain-containing protein [Puniceicoccales bacterium]
MGTLFKNFSNWKKERQLARSEHVCIVPSDLCFMSTCPFPEGKVSFSVIESIVALALESSSPFPLNEIFGGYFIDNDTSTIHIFSVLKNRLKAIIPEVESAAYILPDFFLAIVAPKISKAIFKYQDYTTIFEKTATNNINLTSIAASDEVEASLPVFEIIEIIPIVEFGLTVRFTHKKNASSDPIEHVHDFSFSNQTILAANMQNLEIKKLQKQNKLTTNIALYGTITTVIFTLIGLCGFLQLRWLLRSETYLTKELTARDEQVKQIQQKEDRAHELDLFTNKKHAYFRGLNRINELRPESVLFESIYASEGENFEIKGSAQNLAELNKFEKILQESLLFKVVRIEDKNNQDDLIHFSLFLTFEKL